MGVYITGDCHGDFRKFSTDSFPEQKGCQETILLLFAVILDSGTTQKTNGTG